MAWTEQRVGDYIVLSESGLVLADNAGTNIEIVTVSSALPSAKYNWANKKFPLTVDKTTVAGAAVVVDAVLQTSSSDATTGDVMGTASSVTPEWTDDVDVDINVASAGTASHSKEVDASGVYAPYARIALKTAGTDLTDAAGRCTVKLAFLANQNVPLTDTGVAIGGDGTTGIGPDPS